MCGVNGMRENVPQWNTVLRKRFQSNTFLKARLSVHTNTVRHIFFLIWEVLFGLLWDDTRTLSVFYAPSVTTCIIFNAVQMEWSLIITRSPAHQYWHIPSLIT